MSTETRYMRKPLTRDGSGNAIEFNVTGNAVKPTALTDPNVYTLDPIQDMIDAGEANVDEVEELWQFAFRTDNLNSDATVVLWFYNKWLTEWYPSAALEVKGESLLDTGHGGVFTMPGVLGTTHVGVQVSGHAGNELYLVHSWS